MDDLHEDAAHIQWLHGSMAPAYIHANSHTICSCDVGKHAGERAAGKREIVGGDDVGGDVGSGNAADTVDGDIVQRCAIELIERVGYRDIVGVSTARVLALSDLPLCPAIGVLIDQGPQRIVQTLQLRDKLVLRDVVGRSGGWEDG
jgi:hypothetical protein